MATTFHSDDDLDLPPLDGEGDDFEEAPLELEPAEDAGDALDDKTGEDEPLDDVGIDEGEVTWLADAEDAIPVDVGAFDVAISAEEDAAIDDEPEGIRPEEDLVTTDESVSVDGGEEGPLADDEELREEDLPALDADDAGEIDEAALFDRAALGEGEELRWDDRAWARADAAPRDGDDDDDGGALTVPGDDPALSARDSTWKRFDDAGRVMAAAFVPGDNVVLALEAPSRPVLVRVRPDGVARIIAEIEASGSGEDEGIVVTRLEWDDARGQLVATGSFGVQAFRPT